MLLKHYKLDKWEKKLLKMTEEQFNDYMMKQYPEMFKQRYPQEGQEVILPMNFGFCIGPGWRHVLDTLCRKLKAIQEATGYICVFDQIKEKLGGGRFYHHIEAKEGRVNTPFDKEWCDLIYDSVNMAEEYTDYVCEQLGVNYRKSENGVYYPGWEYGMSMKGFKKFAKEQWGKNSGERIKVAVKLTNHYKELKEVKDVLYSLDEKDLKEVKAFLKAKEKARSKDDDENSSKK